MNKINKVGIILVVLYLAINVLLWIYASECRGWFCGLIVFAPTLPWFFTIDRMLFGSWDKFILIRLGIYNLLNIILIYFIGIFINRLFKKVRKKNIN